MKKGYVLGWAVLLLARPAAMAQVPPGYPDTEWLITQVRTGDTEVFRVNPATGTAVNITRAPQSEERYPAWSPDGRWVVFTSNRSDGKTYDLYRANADGSQVLRLTQLPAGGVAYWPGWTADGTYLYFNEGNSSTICRVRPDGTGFERVTEGRDGQVSPDGTRIVFTQRGRRGFGVWTMRADGSDRRQVVTAESEIGGIAPVWSPDGRFIAFSGQVDRFAEIFVCEADGKNLRQLTNLQQISSSPAFSPDGKYLTFRVTNEAYWRDTQKMAQTYRDKEADKRPVWLIGTDGSNPRLVEPLHYQCAMDGSRAEWKPR